MKKSTLILLAMLLNVALFSCTPQAIIDESVLLQACCGEEGNIPPPPPPPPPTKKD